MLRAVIDIVPLGVTTTGWAVTVGLVLLLLAIDLALAVARPHEVRFREATIWSLFYVAVAVGFGVIFGSIAGWDFGGQYFAGYIVEKSPRQPHRSAPEPDRASACWFAALAPAGVPPRRGPNETPSRAPKGPIATKRLK